MEDNAGQADAFYQLVLDSLPNQVAVIDRHGCTRFSNAAWRAHFEGVLAPAAEHLMGQGRYLDACEAALTECTGASPANLAQMRLYLAALRDVISGARDNFSMDYAVPGHQRWFRVRLARSKSGNGDTVIQRENITVEKHAELGAESTRQFLQSLIDLLPTRVLWKDTTGRILGANRAFLDDAGNPEVIGKTDPELRWAPDDATRIQADDRRVMEGGMPDFNQQRELTLPDGSRRWLRMDRMPLLRADGSTSGILLAYSDITNLKRTEDALARRTIELKASEQRLRATVESAELGLYEANLASGVVTLRAGWCRLVGLPATDTQSTIADYHSRIHPDDLRRVNADTQAGALGGDALFQIEYRLRCEHGCWMWVHDAGRVVERDAASQPLRLVGVITDVTRRKDVEQESQSRAERLDLAARSAAIAVWDQDLRTGRNYWDARMREIYGLSPDLPNEAIGTKVMAHLCHPADLDRLRATIHGALASSDHFDCEFRVIRDDGEQRHVDVRAIIHRDADGSPVRVIGITMDVTERNRLVQERQQAQRLEAIGQLAAGIAHEINTPTQYIGDNTRFVQTAFAGVLSLLDQLRSNPPPTPAELQSAWDAADAEYLRTEIPRAIEQSLEGINRVAGIVRAMRDFSHPATDRMPHDLNRAIESTLAVATNEWNYVAEVVTHLDPALPRVPVMPGEFNQVILNMVVNAAHAIAAVRSKGRITLTTSLGGDHAVITIADNGCGMSAEVQKRIFEPFFTTKGVGEGTGQGLALTHNFITRHGGTISVESAPGCGTQFTIRLPLTIVDEPATVT
ncbi:MAG: PAS domain-containing protein [Gammaproteobacteria bacterium]